MSAKLFLVNPVHAALAAADATPRRVPILHLLRLAMMASEFPAIFFGAAGLFLGVGLHDNANSEWQSGQVVIVVTLALLGALFLVTGTIPAIVLGRRLRRHGRLICGEVVASSATISSGHTEGDYGGGGFQWSEVNAKIEFAFLSPGGERIEVKVNHVFPGTAWDGPQPGDAIAVLYLNDRIYQVL
jgi:hypothetical protein